MEKFFLIILIFLSGEIYARIIPNDHIINNKNMSEYNIKINKTDKIDRMICIKVEAPMRRKNSVFTTLSTMYVKIIDSTNRIIFSTNLGAICNNKKGVLYYHFCYGKKYAVKSAALVYISNNQTPLDFMHLENVINSL